MANAHLGSRGIVSTCQDLGAPGTEGVEDLLWALVPDSVDDSWGIRALGYPLCWVSVVLGQGGKLPWGGGGYNLVLTLYEAATSVW